MIRIVIEHLLLFLLPTIVYVVYHILVARRSTTVGEALSVAPLIWLFGAGLATVAAFIAYFATFEGGRPGEAYYPPVEQNGRIVPSNSPDALDRRAAPAGTPSRPTAPN